MSRWRAFRGRQLGLDDDGRRLGGGVEDAVGGRVVRGGRVVQAAQRRGVDDDGLARPQRGVLDLVHHLDALVDRPSGLRVIREPEAFLGRHRDDALLVAADAGRVDHRRLRGVVAPLILRELLLPPELLAGVRVERDQRVGARVESGPQAGLVERRRRAGVEVHDARLRIDRARRPVGAAADRAAELPPRLLFRRNRPVGVLPGGPEVGVPGHEEAAHAVVGARGADQEEVVETDRRARLRIAEVGRRARHRVPHRHVVHDLARARVEREQLHVERRQVDVAVAVGDAASATMPKFLKTPRLAGAQCHLTAPVAAFSA